MDEKRKAERTGRASARPARVALTHATGVLLAIVAVLSLLSARAYALPGSERNGYPLGEILMSENVGANRGTAVYGAANEFFATLCLIGHKSDYLQLSSEQLSELSGEVTGGAFYELSQRWSNLASDGAPVDWPIGIGLAIEGQGLVSDPAYIWYADYSYYESDSLFNRALDDYLTIYNGGHLGGGGGSVGFPSSFVVTSRRYASNYRSPATVQDSAGVTYYFGGSNARQVSPTYNVTVNTPQMSGLPSSYDRFYFKLLFGYGAGKCQVTIYATDTEYQPVYGTDGYGDSRVSRFNRPSGANGPYKFNPVVCSCVLTGDSISLTLPSSISFVNNTSETYIDVSSNQCMYSDGTGNSGGGGGGGGGTWPEPDPTPQPDPPRVPEPQEPTGPGIDPPNPIGYTIDPTDDPDPVTDPYVVVVAPDSQDIIPWLRAILQAINNLGDKLNDESTELQRALNDVFFGNLSKLLKNIKGEFLQDFTQWLDLELEWMMESIESLFLDLQDYLHDLFEWLADQMNFEFDISTDPYDDTSLLNWLRRIYNKLGADDGPNTRPVDPSTDPEGFLDWLRRMIAEFILGLGASASDLVSDIGDLLSRLFAKFPFSVPWDILAILGLLDAPPVAPHIQFSIPVPLGADSFNWSVDIDMQVWSTYVEAVRTVILLSFISWLAWLTPQVLRDLDPGDFL